MKFQLAPRLAQRTGVYVSMCACTCVRVGVGACMHVLKELRVHMCARVDGSARAHVIGVFPFSLSQQEAAVCEIRLLLLLLFSPPLSSPRGAHGMPEGSPRWGNQGGREDRRGAQESLRRRPRGCTGRPRRESKTPCAWVKNRRGALPCL